MTIYIGGEQPGAGQLFLPPWDKVVHFITFGAIGVLAGFAWPNMSLPKILLLVTVLGMSDEIHQLFLSGRVASLDDLAADFFGGLAALPVIEGLRRYVYQKSENPGER
jgi:VanZ family protein